MRVEVATKAPKSADRALVGQDGPAHNRNRKAGGPVLPEPRAYGAAGVLVIHPSASSGNRARRSCSTTATPAACLAPSLRCPFRPRGAAQARRPSAARPPDDRCPRTSPCPRKGSARRSSSAAQPPRCSRAPGSNLDKNLSSEGSKLIGNQQGSPDGGGVAPLLNAAMLCTSMSRPPGRRPRRGRPYSTSSTVLAAQATREVPPTNVNSNVLATTVWRL